MTAQSKPERYPTQWIFLSAFLFLLTAAAVWLFTQRYWWLTPLASEHGRAADQMFSLTLGITGVLFVILQISLAVVIARFRNRGSNTISKAARPHVENRFALIAGILVLSVDMTLFALGDSNWFRAWGPPPEGAAVVEVTASQFMWHFRYPGADGVFGKTDRSLLNSDNPTGLDPGDPASLDDIVSVNEVHVPVNQPVRLRLKSKDVIHSFYLPNFRVKQDAVPGLQIEIWFIPRSEGRFEIACNQLCGLLHHKMRGFLIVESKEEVDEWLAETARQSGD